MKFIINVLGAPPAVMTWRHGTEDAARREAEKIAKDLHCEVLVSQLVGTYKPRIEWIDERPSAA